jgi:hypothetical protein
VKLNLKAETAVVAQTWLAKLKGFVKEGDGSSSSDSEDEEDAGKKKKGKKKKKDKKKLEYPPDRLDTIWVSLTILKARKLVSKDSNGKSDPYVTATVLEEEVDKKAKLPPLGISSVIKASLDPDWGAKSKDGLGEELGSYAPRGCKIQVMLSDHDDRGGDDFLGECTIDLSELRTGCTSVEPKWYELGDKVLKRNAYSHVFILLPCCCTSLPCCVSSSSNPTLTKLLNQFVTTKTIVRRFVGT